MRREEIIREAWDLILVGARDYVQEDFNEDGRFSDEDHQRIVRTAKILIDGLAEIQLARKLEAELANKNFKVDLV
jgi:hypothetical protein